MRQEINRAYPFWRIALALAILFPTLFLLFSPPVLGEENLTFMPSLARFFGDLELDSVYESNSKESNSIKQRSTHTGFKELFNVGTVGYVYHPRLLSFLLKGGVGLKQESFNFQDGTTHSSDSAGEYAARGIFLPEHPYNLEFFTLRESPLIIGNLSDTRPRDRRSSGAILRYEQRPWKSSLKYTLDEIGPGVSEVSTYQGMLSYVKSFFNLYGQFQHSDTTDFGRRDNKSDKYSIINELHFTAVTLSSSLDVLKDYTVYENSDRQSERETRHWDESLNINLPWNFDLESYYQETREYLAEYDIPFFMEPELVNSSQRVNGKIRHRLYNSLTSNLSGSYQENVSPNGQNRQSDYILNETYNKNIPTGKFTAGFWIGSTTIDQQGALIILDENRTVVPGVPFYEIRMGSRFIDEQTITITVHDANNNEAELVRSVHWQIAQPITDPLVIQIIDLPAAEGFFLADILTYTFQVSYSLLNLQYKLETDRFGYLLRLDMLDNFLVPFYRHDEQSPEVISGFVPYAQVETITDSFGLTINTPPYRFSGGYTRIKSSTNPERRWNSRAEYMNKVTNFTNLNCSLEYEKVTTQYNDSTGVPESEQYNRTFISRIRLNSYLPNLALSTSLVGDYVIRSASGADANSYSLGGNFRWQHGRTDITLDTRYTNTRTKTSVDVYTNDDTRVQLTIKRKFF